MGVAPPRAERRLPTGLLMLGAAIVGFLLLALVGVTWLVLTIMACIESNKGVAYRYPFTLRLIS